MLEKKFEIIVKTLYGLENIVAKEIKDFGLSEIEMGNRFVRCFTDLEHLYKLNLALSTALRILIPIKSFTAKNEENLYAQIKKIDWQKFLTVKQTFSIESVVNSKYFKHSKYAALKCKDAIADYFRSKENQRPSVDTKDPDLKIQLHISQSECTILLDSSGDSLHKRGYRLDKNPAPLNEILAAGMLRITKLADKESINEKKILIDPMCGSGTIPIEAAFLSTNTPPCLNRNNFNFMKWKNFNPVLFNIVKKELEQKICKPKFKISASDISLESIRISRQNIRRAGFTEIIELEKKDFFKSTNSYTNGIIIMNPPYGERLKIEDAKNFYKLIGNKFKTDFQNFSAWVISSNFEALKFLGLKPSKKIVLFNGPLECKFQKYELYSGSKKRKKNTD